MTSKSIIAILFSILSMASVGTAFVPLPPTSINRASRLLATTTVEAPTEEMIRTGQEEDDDDDIPDLEYLIDSQEMREMEEPFHILLLGSTFEKPKITVSYVCGSLEYVLSMPFDEAMELSQFARDEGMSCLGVWTREECLKLGRQLQWRDIVCRVVPYTEGGQRGWQAKDVNEHQNAETS